MLRKMLFGCALATLVTLSTATTAVAQEPLDQRTFFTFSAPFELPGGKVLPAGKYTFRIVDSPSNRHVVQILSEDGKQMHATILAIPAQRQDPPEDPEVRFMETAANAPPAVKTWWYPGRTIGHEFIYPKEQARRLAARQSEPVLTVETDVTSTEEMQTADLSRIDASGKETDVAVTTETTTTRRTEAQPAPGRMPPPAPTRTIDETLRVEETRTALPKTASVLPLLGLIGLASLAGAAIIRRRRA
jgi:LPXTG-motif cell wall-anchored protein